MIGALTNSRSSKAKGWALILLVLGIIAVLYAVFDLTNQFKLRDAAREVASAASQSLLRRPQQRPSYRQVAPEAQAPAASR